MSGSEEANAAAGDDFSVLPAGRGLPGLGPERFCSYFHQPGLNGISYHWLPLRAWKFCSWEALGPAGSPLNIVAEKLLGLTIYTLCGSTVGSCQKPPFPGFPLC